MPAYRIPVYVSLYGLTFLFIMSQKQPALNNPSSYTLSTKAFLLFTKVTAEH
jgi:hypothetical protein